MATQADITIDQGTSVVIPLIFKKLTNQSEPYDPVTNPYVPLNLSGVTIRMQVRKDYDASTTVLSFSSSGDYTPRIFITDAANGYAEIRILPADTSYTGGVGVKISGETFEGVYDVEVDDGTTVIRAFQGTFTITREVTR